MILFFDLRCPITNLSTKVNWNAFFLEILYSVEFNSLRIILICFRVFPFVIGATLRYLNCGVRCHAEICELVVRVKIDGVVNFFHVLTVFIGFRILYHAPCLYQLCCYTYSMKPDIICHKPNGFRHVLKYAVMDLYDFVMVLCKYPVSSS